MGKSKYQEMYKRENGTYGIRAKGGFQGIEAQQQFKDETDINKIMKKYHSGIMTSHLNRNPGRYGDFSQVKNYQESLNTVIKAQNSFMTLPSEIRFRFQNDPQKLLEFLADSKNKEEAIKLGIINADQTIQPEVLPNQIPLPIEENPTNTTTKTKTKN